MNPINAINQEFARMVVEQWSDEAAEHHQEQQAGKARLGIAAIRALVGWVRAWIDRRQGTTHPALLPKSTN